MELIALIIFVIILFAFSKGKNDKYIPQKHKYKFPKYNDKSYQEKSLDVVRDV